METDRWVLGAINNTYYMSFEPHVSSGPHNFFAAHRIEDWPCDLHMRE